MDRDIDGLEPFQPSNRDIRIMPPLQWIMIGAIAEDQRGNLWLELGKVCTTRVRHICIHPVSLNGICYPCTGYNGSEWTVPAHFGLPLRLMVSSV
jgi:hypothetical protein